jgi:hypothetical protein
LTDEREAAENEILAERFARAGALGGGLGGGAGAGPAGLVGGSRGGARGARRAAARMNNNVCELELTLPVDAEAALEQVTATLSQQGELIEPPYATPRVPAVAAVTGSWWQNPAVVTVEIRTSDAHGSRVRIRAVAKRSPILRHSGDKAAQRLRDALAGS